MRTRKKKAWSSSSLRAPFRPRPGFQSEGFKLRLKGLFLSPWPPYVGALVCSNHRKAVRPAAAVRLAPGLPVHEGRVTVASHRNERASGTADAQRRLRESQPFEGWVFGYVQPSRARRVW